jgi:small basic protein
MSQVVAEKFYLISTVLGVVGVRASLKTEYDVEDIIQARAASQARAVQFVNIGQQLDANAQLPAASVPSVFQNNTQQLVAD